MNKPDIDEKVISYLKSVESEEDQIHEARKKMLRDVSDYIAEKRENAEPVNIIFICTHNSRRSHMSQIWAEAAAYYYGIEGVRSFSGGTEGTAFNPRAVAAMRKAGFNIEQLDSGSNPQYRVKFFDSMDPMIAFSKEYGHQSNPQKNYAAIMVCSDADEACPVAIGADARFSLPFRDPKEFDGTAQEEQMYDERCRQIAREIVYIFKNAK